MKTLQLAREKGIKLGLFRPITLWPFPSQRLFDLAQKVKGMLCVEQSAGQMIEDVQLATKFTVPVEHFGRMGGMVPTPEEVMDAFEQKMIGG